MSTKQISSLQRIWCRGVPILSNPLTFLITFKVSSLQSRFLVDTSPLFLDLSIATSFDLSTATKLKHLVFQCARPNVQWVTTALQSVKSKGLERITVRPDADTFVRTIKEPVHQQWHDLDRQLVDFWTSHSIRPKVTYEAGARRKDMRDCTQSLLPELTRRGLVDLVECDR